MKTGACVFFAGWRRVFVAPVSSIFPPQPARARVRARVAGGDEAGGGRGPPPLLFPSPHLPRRFERQLLQQVGQGAARFFGRHGERESERREGGSARERGASGRRDSRCEGVSLFVHASHSAPPLFLAAAPPPSCQGRALTPTLHRRRGDRARTQHKESETLPPSRAHRPRLHPTPTPARAHAHAHTHTPWACGCPAWRPCLAATRRPASWCSASTTRARRRSSVRGVGGGEEGEARGGAGAAPRVATRGGWAGEEGGG